MSRTDIWLENEIERVKERIRNYSTQATDLEAQAVIRRKDIVTQIAILAELEEDLSALRSMRAKRSGGAV